MTEQHLPGIKAQFVETPRLRQSILVSGDRCGEAVIFIHGNFSSSTYFEELMVAMPKQYYCIAVDLRGYGDTEAKLIDATRGARDWSDDLYSLLQALGISCAHWLGWSAGAAPLMQLKIDHSDCVRSLIFVAPVSPQGFGGSRNAEGDACYADFAGSGGGLVAEAFIQQIAVQDRSREHEVSPLNIIHNSYFYKSQALLRESALLSGSLKQQLGGQQYPGDCIESTNWPFKAPGIYGPLNAISAKYFDAAAFADGPFYPPVLWVRGDQDLIISNRSLSDSAVLGEMGLIEGWPGAEIFPAQPMVDQMRYLLQAYERSGGSFDELVFPDVGHSPFIEVQDDFLENFLVFIKAIS